MSYPYIVAVETGRLPLTSSLAEALSCATGIAPNWLLGEGRPSDPITPFGMSYTRDYFITNFQRRHIMPDAMDLDGDESREIHDRCHELTQLMRVAYRKRRFAVALYFLRKTFDDTAKAP